MAKAAMAYVQNVDLQRVYHVAIGIVPTWKREHGFLQCFCDDFIPMAFASYYAPLAPRCFA